MRRYASLSVFLLTVALAFAFGSAPSFSGTGRDKDVPPMKKGVDEDIARTKFEELQKRLPNIVTTWKKEQEDLEGYTAKVRVVRRIAPFEAKVTIRMETSAKALAEDALLTVYLRYYDGAWTTTRFESAWGYLPKHRGERTARFLMLAIDETAPSPSPKATRAASPASKLDLSKEDLKKMQGEWFFVRAEDGPLQPRVPGAVMVKLKKVKRVVIAGNRIKYCFGEEDGNIIHQWSITLDARKKPKVFDSTGDSNYLGIYRLDGDTLTICSRYIEAGERPAHFDASQPAVNLEVWRRKK